MRASLSEPENRNDDNFGPTLMMRNKYIYIHIHRCMSIDLRKKRKTLFEPYLRLKNGENCLRKPQELSHLLAIQAQLCQFFKTEGWTSYDILLRVYTIQI